MSLATDLAARLRARIDAGELAPGERLPAVRELAAVEHVSPAVAGEAYALLQREGGSSRASAAARTSRGRATAAARWSTWPRTAGRPRSRRRSTCRSGWRRRAPRAINLSAGLPIVDAAVPPPWRAEMEAVVREDGARLFQYGAPRGDAGLREVVAAAWRARGLDADAERILSPPPGQQAIDLAVRALVEPGDTVLCETPTYAGAIDSLVAARARIVPVPTDAHGLLVDRVAEIVRRERPRRCSSTRRATTPRARCCRRTGARRSPPSRPRPASS